MGSHTHTCLFNESNNLIIAILKLIGTKKEIFKLSFKRSGGGRTVEFIEVLAFRVSMEMDHLTVRQWIAKSKSYNKLLVNGRR